MVTLNDYLYSGDTIFKIIQNYMTDLRKEAKRTHNEIDLVHSNCLLQVQEMLEHNDFLTSQSQKIREFFTSTWQKNFHFSPLHFVEESNLLIRTEEKFNGYIVEYIYNYYEEHGTYPAVADLKEKTELFSGYYRISDCHCIAEMSSEAGTESRRERDEISLSDSQCAAGISGRTRLYSRAGKRSPGE